MNEHPEGGDPQQRDHIAEVAHNLAEDANKLEKLRAEEDHLEHRIEEEAEELAREDDETETAAG